jgi:putative endonuclease
LKKYYTYILQSLRDGSFYTGVTENLEIRLSEHNSGLSKYTSTKKPWKIVYYEFFDDLSSARKRESFLKKQRNRDFYLRLIEEFNRAQLVTPSARGDC